MSTLDKWGFDVLYIIAGTRSTEAMSPTHQNLINAYEAAPESLRQAAFAVLLSPYKSALLDKPINTPGYFQHQILGEDDVRYEEHRTLEMKASTDKPQD